MTWPPALEHVRAMRADGKQELEQQLVRGGAFRVLVRRYWPRIWLNSLGQ